MQRRKGDFLAEEAARPWRGNGAVPKPPKPQACCGVLVRSAQGRWQQGRRPVFAHGRFHQLRVCLRAYRGLARWQRVQRGHVLVAS